MRPSGNLRAGVIGVGHLGRHHARIYHQLPQTDLVAVSDINESQGRSIASQYQCAWVRNCEDLIGKIDLASIAVPTTDHSHIAARMLDAGIHVLVEKPITSEIEDGRAIVEKASENGLILMVGQSERFNPAITAASALVADPRFIEVHRLGPFSTRATDVDVILDLMIHDIDLILNWVRSDLTEIRAMGVPVLSDRIDIANTRLQFENGCTANVTASRISLTATRKVRIFQPDSYISVDCLNQSVSCFRRKISAVPDADPMAMIEPVPVKVEQTEPLVSEIGAFVDAVAGHSDVPVPGEAGLNALEVCHRISREIREAAGR
ncbi:Gfo/Idh/MocA family oxidoreductase [bacterium]|nr:Gfo/Idh/MocA family oxidoreductase [candidate division CSSED10-310 bacterium]